MNHWYCKLIALYIFIFCTLIPLLSSVGRALDCRCCINRVVTGSIPVEETSLFLPTCGEVEGHCFVGMTETASYSYLKSFDWSARVMFYNLISIRILFNILFVFGSNLILLLGGFVVYLFIDTTRCIDCMYLTTTVLVCIY